MKICIKKFWRKEGKIISKNCSRPTNMGDLHLEIQRCNIFYFLFE